jgi:hypothetical protein
MTQAKICKHEMNVVGVVLQIANNEDIRRLDILVPSVCRWLASVLVIKEADIPLEYLKSIRFNATIIGMNGNQCLINAEKVAPQGHYVRPFSGRIGLFPVLFKCPDICIL